MASSTLYAPFRALGHITQGAFGAVVFKMGKADAYVATSVGRGFQIFDVSVH